MMSKRGFFDYLTLDFLWYDITREVLHTQSDKVEWTMKAKVSVNKKQQKSFLGLAGFYHKFLPIYATITAPLLDITKKGSRNN